MVKIKSRLVGNAFYLVSETYKIHPHVAIDPVQKGNSVASHHNVGCIPQGKFHVHSHAITHHFFYLLDSDIITAAALSGSHSIAIVDDISCAIRNNSERVSSVKSSCCATIAQAIQAL